MSENGLDKKRPVRRFISTLLYSSLGLFLSVANVDAQNPTLSYDIGTHLSRMTANQIDSQLHVQREFVQQEIQQAQSVLQSLLEANFAVSSAMAQDQYRAMMSERVADYAKAQKEVFEAYTDFLRLRQAVIFDVFAEEVDAATWSFARTGYIAPPPTLVAFEPLPSPSLDLGSAGYFPGLPSRTSGFFGQIAVTP